MLGRRKTSSGRANVFALLRKNFQEASRSDNPGVEPRSGEVFSIARHQIGRTTGLRAFKEDVVVWVATESNGFRGPDPKALFPNRVKRVGGYVSREAKSWPSDDSRTRHIRSHWYKVEPSRR